MNHIAHQQFVPSSSADRWQDGPIATVMVEPTLKVGTFAISDFVAYVTVYRDYSGEWAVGEIEVEAFQGKQQTRMAVQQARNGYLDLPHFYADATYDEIDKRAVSYRIEEELSKVEREWEA